MCSEQALPYLDLGTSFQREFSRDPEARLSLEHATRL